MTTSAASGVSWTIRLARLRLGIHDTKARALGVVESNPSDFRSHSSLTLSPARPNSQQTTRRPT